MTEEGQTIKEEWVKVKGEIMKTAEESPRRKKCGGRGKSGGIKLYGNWITESGLLLDSRAQNRIQGAIQESVEKSKKERMGGV
jgi:succinyl-CoA synthetase beta subunit